MQTTAADRQAIRRAAARSTKASAALENRVVPAGYVRPEKLATYVEELRDKK